MHWCRPSLAGSPVGQAGASPTSITCFSPVIGWVRPGSWRTRPWRAGWKPRVRSSDSRHRRWWWQMALSEAVLTRWFEDHRTFLWGVCYRVTGSAADADDAVQETFIRALKHAPKELAEPRRWLVTVAVT